MNICTRQTAFLGPKNQKKIQAATIAIVGVGALGSASAHLLTRMGIGKLILIDDDVVADHNLGRQHMYTKQDINQKKVNALAKRLQEIRDIDIEIHDKRLIEENNSLLDSADLVVDATDNHATRRLIDAYCKQKQMSWVHGAAIEDKGSVAFFPPTLAYDDIYAGKTKDQHCEISGVLATTTTAIATLQTHIALKALIGEEIPRVLYHLNGLNWSEINL